MRSWPLRKRWRREQSSRWFVSGLCLFVDSALFYKRICGKHKGKSSGGVNGVHHWYANIPGMLSIAAVGAVAAISSAGPCTGRCDIIELEGQGTISGVADSQGSHFLGVPFASPPTGNFRWQPPQPPIPWNGTRDAKVPCACCFFLAERARILLSAASLHQADATRALARGCPVGLQCASDGCWPHHAAIFYRPMARRVCRSRTFSPNLRRLMRIVCSLTSSCHAALPRPHPFRSSCSSTAGRG